LDSIKYADEQMIYIAAQFPQLGDELSIIRLTILEAYRAGRMDTFNSSYTDIARIFTRKQSLDLNHENINDVDEFRRISRHIEGVAHYLDYKGVPE
jgi:hypothetical protein